MKFHLKLIVLSFFIFLASSSAYAESVYCWTAGIVNVSTADTGTVTPPSGASPFAIKLNCPALFPETRKFWLGANLSENGLAVLLTARSLEEKVTVLLEGTNQGSLITQVNIKGPEAEVAPQ